MQRVSGHMKVHVKTVASFYSDSAFQPPLCPACAKQCQARFGKMLISIITTGQSVFRSTCLDLLICIAQWARFTLTLEVSLFYTDVLKIMILQAHSVFMKISVYFKKKNVKSTWNMHKTSQMCSRIRNVQHYKV